jgi:hypothetical protein
MHAQQTNRALSARMMLLQDTERPHERPSRRLRRSVQQRVYLPKQAERCW